MPPFNGVKVFSATLARDREELGDKVTDWLQRHQHCQITDMRVVQSSDREFHCVTVVLLYHEPGVGMPA